MNLIKSLIRFFIRRPLYFIRRNLYKMAISYVLSVVPFGFSMTALTTSTPLTNFSTITNIYKNSGVINILTAGLMKPVFNGGKVALGSIKYSLGKTFNSKNLLLSGQSLVNNGKSWFNQGKLLSNNVTSIISTENTDISSWTFKDYPNYYNITGLSNLDINQFDQNQNVSYNDLDSLGRTMGINATITTSVLKNKTNNTTNFSKKPAGWSDSKKVSIPWLYGKSSYGNFWSINYLLPDTLGGELQSNNIITGTINEYIGGPNQDGGVRFIEKKILNYLKSNKNNKVFCQIEPVYKDNELIPRAIIYRLKSIDNSIDEQIVVYNTSNTYKINYNNGNYKPI